ncbi:MAG: DNA topoisomerase I, partial [Bacteroidales bacterium]|nr:DNA topoisomerase I [Bacteroidales bacterium]
RFTNPPYRYSEATLVRKLEELGIGRPSTYAPIISTIQRREYVEKGDKLGKMIELTTLILMDGKITEKVKKEKTGFVKGRLFPTDIGVLVNNFLMKNFKNIMNYNFTADVEKEFDEIAKGEQAWNQMINEFYGPFHKQVEETLKSSDKAKGEKLLGQDPESGKNIYVKLGRYGAIVQLGDTDNTVKPRFAGLKKNQTMDSITLEDALDLFKLPRTLGNFEENEVIVASGRFGPYIRHKSSFYSLKKDDDPLTIQLSHAIELIAEKRKQDKENIITEFEENKDVRVLKGRYGPYISIGKSNYKIPKTRDPESLTLKDCLELAEQVKTTKAKKKPRKK